MHVMRAEEIGLGVPPPLVPKRPEAVRVPLLGRRLVLNGESWVRDVVAATNIYEQDGRTYIGVLTAREYDLPEAERPEPRPWPVHLVWLED